MNQSVSRSERATAPPTSTPSSVTGPSIRGDENATQAPQPPAQPATVPARQAATSAPHTDAPAPRPAAVPRRAVFLDRDGTILVDTGYPSDPNGVRLLPGAQAALATLQSAGFLLVVVSNQSGVGRGYLSPEQARSVHDRMQRELDSRGIHLAGAYYCPHAPEDGCDCRKPRPGLVRRAASELGIDLAASFVVGDKPSDVEAGRAAGCRTVFLAPVRDAGLAAEPAGRSRSGAASDVSAAEAHGGRRLPDAGPVAPAVDPVARDGAQRPAADCLAAGWSAAVAFIVGQEESAQP